MVEALALLARAPRTAEPAAHRRHDRTGCSRPRAPTPAFALGRAGEQALANVLQRGRAGAALRGDAAASRSAASSSGCARRPSGEAPEAPIVEEGSEGVRIMTVHRAKGLEFPVVILADIDRGHRRQAQPLRGSGAGALRAAAGWLAAVGAARARERELRARSRRGRARGLRRRDARARPAGGARRRRRAVRRRMGRSERRLAGPVHRAVYPPAERRRAPQEAAGCPRSARTACSSGRTAHAGTRQRPPGAARVRLGRHRYGVVVVGSAAARPRSSRSTGCGATTSSRTPAGRSWSGTGRAYEQWLSERRQAQERGAQPEHSPPHRD